MFAQSFGSIPTPPNLSSLGRRPSTASEARSSRSTFPKQTARPDGHAFLAPSSPALAGSENPKKPFWSHPFHSRSTSHPDSPTFGTSEVTDEPLTLEPTRTSDSSSSSSSSITSSSSSSTISSSDTLNGPLSGFGFTRTRSTTLFSISSSRYSPSSSSRQSTLDLPLPTALNLSCIPLDIFPTFASETYSLAPSCMSAAERRGIFASRRESRLGVRSYVRSLLSSRELVH
ncbi:hypothetical protein JCM8097_006974 [Rhodosporidiobolus ruineniae]